jgi:hypothetical protein
MQKLIKMDQYSFFRTTHTFIDFVAMPQETEPYQCPRLVVAKQILLHMPLGR